ncbi:tetratricopeptide repeat protein [Rickettsia endosymbiont of Pantilius tunicatus]|uniref:tetratricopeptide repeat protein n=1 Tax=Rickettsia endosymbiont of Pantilius tunicatus TaxID=3066267 RepID=UPI00376F0968
MRMSEEEQKTCLKKGINYLDQGKYEEALKVFGMLLIVEPRNASLHYYRGNTLHKLKRYDEAIESFKAAIKLKPREGAYYYGLASSYYAVGNGTAGIDALQKAVSAQGQQEDIYCKTNILSGIKKESNQDQVIQLNISACKEQGQYNYQRQYSGLKVGDNYSFGWHRQVK